MGGVRFERQGVMKNKVELSGLKTMRNAVCMCIAAALLYISSGTAFGASSGAARKIPAFYDGQMITVNMMELPNSDALIANNGNLNEIYAYTDLDEEQPFAPIVDAIQGEGFNPLWRQILIVFNPGFTPHQFFSADEVEDAAAGANPEITLVETDEVYRCSVVGSKR